MSCNICTNTYNKVTRKEIICPYCAFACCKGCSEKYILDQTIAKCMNNDCKKEWSRKFLVENFTKSFLSKEWKDNIEKVLFDREVSLLPATQIVVERRKEVMEVRKNINRLYKVISDIRRTIIQHENDIIELNNYDNASLMKERRSFVKACPDGSCRGFLSSQWKCGVCDFWVCPECNAIKGKEKNCEHTCDPNELATAKLLKSDTKPCPKCGEGIFKIEGCDQMWCTQCYTAFNWRTGNIETKQVHNPHYFEWMRQTGGLNRNIHDDYICGQRFGIREHSIISRSHKINYEIKLKIDYISASIWHLRDYQIEKYEVNDVEDNLELRVRYLEKDIDRPEFQRVIQRQNKKYLKKREIYNILDLFTRTITEILLRMLQHVCDENPNILHSKEHYQNYIKEMYYIKDYCNECLLDVSKTYNSRGKHLEFYNSARGNIRPGRNLRDVIL